MNNNNEFGDVKISKDVLAKIIDIAAMENENVSGCKNEFLGKKSKSMKIQFDENKELVIELWISFYYGTDIKKTVPEVQEAIINSIETMTSLKVSKVNVNVYDITLAEEK